MKKNLAKKEEALKKMRKNLEDSKGQILLWEEYDAVCEKGKIPLQKSRMISLLYRKI